MAFLWISRGLKGLSGFWNFQTFEVELDFQFSRYLKSSEMIIPLTYGEQMSPFIKSSYRVILTRGHIIKGSIKVICGTPLCAFDSAHVIYNASYYSYPTVVQTLSLPILWPIIPDYLRIISRLKVKFQKLNMKYSSGRLKGQSDSLSNKSLILCQIRKTGISEYDS